MSDEDVFCYPDVSRSVVVRVSISQGTSIPQVAHDGPQMGEELLLVGGGRGAGRSNGLRGSLRAETVIKVGRCTSQIFLWNAANCQEDELQLAGPCRGFKLSTQRGFHLAEASGSSGGPS